MSNRRAPRGGDQQWEQSPEWHRLRVRMIEELLPMLKESAVTISICPPDAKPDVKYAVELGFSIMLDKPILVCAQVGTPIPEHLRRVADRIVVADLGTAAGLENSALAVKEFLRDFGPSAEHGDE